jgi:hypothetical protein
MARQRLSPFRRHRHVRSGPACTGFAWPVVRFNRTEGHSRGRLRFQTRALPRGRGMLLQFRPSWRNETRFRTRSTESAYSLSPFLGFARSQVPLLRYQPNVGRSAVLSRLMPHLEPFGHSVALSRTTVCRVLLTRDLDEEPLRVRRADGKVSDRCNTYPLHPFRRSVYGGRR